MENGSKSKDWEKKLGFSLLNFVVVFLFIIRSIGGFMLLLAEVRASIDCKILSSHTAPTTNAYLDMIGIV